MPIFITQGRYTPQAIAGLLDRPEDRAAAVGALYEAAGGRMLAFYVTTGEYDWLSIAEMPDAAADLAVLIAGASKGAVSDLKTIQAFSEAEFSTACERAKGLAATFKAAGAD